MSIKTHAHPRSSVFFNLEKWLYSPRCALPGKSIGLELTADPQFSLVLMNDYTLNAAPSLERLTPEPLFSSLLKNAACPENLFELDLTLDLLFSPAMVNVSALNEAPCLERLLVLKFVQVLCFLQFRMNSCTLNGAPFPKRLLRHKLRTFFYKSI